EAVQRGSRQRVRAAAAPRPHVRAPAQASCQPARRGLLRTRRRLPRRRHAERRRRRTVSSGEVTREYAPIGDLRLYYEIHGEGRPLLLLHGAYMTVDMLDPLLSGLAATRQVIAPEQQAHGHTADIDRPITYEAMADDTAALLAHLEIDEADVFGYSM